MVSMQEGVLMTPEPPAVYCTVKELAERWKRTTRTVRQYIADGKLKAIQFTDRGPHLVALTEVERFERENANIKN